jgi:hypothetical protein
MFQKDFIYTGVLFPTMTFGTHGKKKLYRCRPFPSDLDDIYIPYKIDGQLPIYILFRYIEMDGNGKHIGTMTDRIGFVNHEESFYKYLLHCSGLVPLSFSKEFSIIKNKIENLSSRKCWNIFTIDPETTRDYDDAFSIRELSPNCFHLGIYIANVPLFLEKNKLWNLLQDRISTIYLPDTNIPLLPRILSEGDCSLHAGKERMVFCMDVMIVNDKIDTIRFDKCSIIVKNNFAYEEKKLLKHKDYRLLHAITKKVFDSPNIDSHSLVSKWMIFMNHQCAKKLEKGILRCSEKIVNINPLFEYKGKYISTKETEKEHVPLHLDIYTHITSPIRRIVDIFNMMYLQHELGIYHFSEETVEACNAWLLRLDYINETMNKIRKVQQQCHWIHLLKTTPNLQEEGIILEKVELEEEMQWKYLVYFPSLNMVKNIYTIDNTKQVRQERKCNFYYFPKEISFQRKVRVEFDG